MAGDPEGEGRLACHSPRAGGLAATAAAAAAAAGGTGRPRCGSSERT